ncbi:MAG: transglutaminaseTgpA domain-containing protein, partial [Ilumatobacteraceae bacterium]
MSGTEQRRLSAFDLWGALALACTSGITVVSLGRAFTDWTFLRTMLLLALGAHAAALALRTMRVSGWVAVPLLLLGGAWAIALSYYGITMGGGVPHGATLDAFLADLRTVLDLFPTAVAPVPSRGAFAAPTAAAVVVAVVLSDTFAFRAGGHSEAVIPQGVLVAVIAAVGTPLWRTGLAAAWTASALLTVGALRARTRHRRGAWMGARPAPLSQAALRLGTIVASAALIGLAVGPHLPGSDAEALVDTEQRPSNITEIVSPLVDIRSELVSSGSRLLFTVESDDGPHYWRLLSLPTFDGRSWNPPEEDLSDLDGELPAASVVSNQRVTVAALGGPMVPAAYRPIDVDSDSDVYWAPDSESLVMPGRGLVSGTVIDIESAVPRRDPATLRATAAADAPSDEYLDVPSSVSPGVTATAVMVTDGTTTDFDRALALQQWFRTSFAYNTD